MLPLAVSAVGLDDPACREAEGGHIPEVFVASEWSFDVENVGFFRGKPPRSEIRANSGGA